MAVTKPGPPDAAVTAMRPSRHGYAIFGILCANKECGNNVNNLKNNLERTLRKPALRKPARGCEPYSDKLSSQLFSLFPIPLSITDGDTTQKGGKYSVAALTAFGESLPIDKQIDAEIDKSDYTVVSVTLVSINPDIKEIGDAWFIHGCEFKWKVVYE